MGALAAVSEQDPRCADRFEVYVCGVELANGYRELTDAAELDARLQSWGIGQQDIATRFRQAMDNGLPESAGVALGLDRLVMLLLGADTVADVQPVKGPLS